MLVRILYHDHCFDGAASAAIFSRFMEGVFHPAAEFAYTGMAHKASQIFEPELFDGDENAIVDFKYSSDPRLTWWFDHHQSAFLNAEDAEHFRRDTSGRKLYDPSYKSCTSFICRVGIDRFGFHAPDLDDLVHWSLIIDGAQYPDANTGFGSFGRQRPPKSIANLFRGHFHRGPVRRQDLCLLKNHKEVLARSTGYALVSSPKVRHVSVGSNAVFIGTLRARVDTDALLTPTEN